jgi:pimeloyl-ACP methyl ester carboxylesterase
VASLPTSREACHRTGPRGGAPAGRHVAALVMIKDRFARRQQVLAEVMAALAASATVQQAGAALAGALNEHLDASVIGVCRLRDGHLSLVHQIGYPAEASDRFAAIALDEPLPFAEAARTGRPVWLHNREDLCIPTEHTTSAHDAFPGSRLELFASAGHFPHRDQPLRFAQVVLDFLATTTASHTDLQDVRRRLRGTSDTATTTAA